MKPTRTHQEALQALAQTVADTSSRVDELRKRQSEGERLPAATLSRAAHAENFAREAFATATGERLGTPQYTALLAEYSAEAQGVAC